MKETRMQIILSGLNEKQQYTYRGDAPSSSNPEPHAEIYKN
jgi:hypothetical protein